MKGLIRFMVNRSGRILRIILGLGLIVFGAFASPVINWILVLIGIIPMAAGLFDFCLSAPLIGYFFSGKRPRQAVNI